MQAWIKPTLMLGVLLGWAGVAAGEPRPLVVELYTSEGCSSCPPAEAYIGELARRGDVLALAFHVDYWDGLGWPDGFALPGATLRQRGYARALALASVYTPQVVIDGRADFVGSDRRAIGRALADARESGIPILLGEAGGNVTVSLGQRTGVAASDVILVAYQRKAVSTIARGENAGRVIEEFNIVRGISTLGRWSGEARSFQTRIDSLPPGATDIAVLLQPPGLGPIIGAASLPIG